MENEMADVTFSGFCLQFTPLLLSNCLNKMPSLSQMRILETNADAADKLLQEINAKV